MTNKKVENTEIAVSEQLFVSEAKQIVQKGRQQAYAAINSAMVETYWQLGRCIVEQEQAGRERADYGTQLLNVLSDELTREFGKGFTARALRYYRQFYLAFPSTEIWNTRVSFLTWSHYRTLLRVDNQEARNWYLKETAEQLIIRCLHQNTNCIYLQKKN